MTMGLLAFFDIDNTLIQSSNAAKNKSMSLIFIVFF